MSGDHAKDRERFRTLFPDNAQLHFSQSPLAKLGFVERLQRSGKVVMMVGDGLNDAGALRQSDVGVAVIAQAGGLSPLVAAILMPLSSFSVVVFACGAATWAARQEGVAEG